MEESDICGIEQSKGHEGVDLRINKPVTGPTAKE